MGRLRDALPSKIYRVLKGKQRLEEIGVQVHHGVHAIFLSPTFLIDVPVPG